VFDKNIYILLIFPRKEKRNKKMKKILCFGDVTDKYKNAIENAMRECPNIMGWETADETDELPETKDAEYIFFKCDIHSDDFLRHVIAINKKLMNGERFYLTHCAVFVDKTNVKPPFILSDAACVPFPDENQLTHIVENAVSLFGRVMDKTRAPFISLISAGGDTNTKLSPLLNSWYHEHVNEFPAGTLRVEQLDVALDAGVRNEKHLTGAIADIIVVDNINTGNAIFKSLSVVAGTWEPLCFLMGAKNMVILNSRGATMETLTHNIIMACRD
jgi:phosphotransacetylase